MFRPVCRVTGDLLQHEAGVFSIVFLYLCWLVKTSRMFALNTCKKHPRRVLFAARVAVRLTNGVGGPAPCKMCALIFRIFPREV